MNIYDTVWTATVVATLDVTMATTLDASTYATWAATRDVTMAERRGDAGLPAVLDSSSSERHAP